MRRAAAGERGSADGVVGERESEQTEGGAPRRQSGGRAMRRYYINVFWVFKADARPRRGVGDACMLYRVCTPLTHQLNRKRKTAVSFGSHTIHRVYLSSSLTRTSDLGRLSLSPASHVTAHMDMDMDMDIVDMDMDMHIYMDRPLFFCSLHTGLGSRVVFTHTSQITRLQVQFDASPAAARARAQEHRRTAGPHARLPRERTRKHNSPCIKKS